MREVSMETSDVVLDDEEQEFLSSQQINDGWIVYRKLQYRPCSGGYAVRGPVKDYCLTDLERYDIPREINGKPVIKADGGAFMPYNLNAPDRVVFIPDSIVDMKDCLINFTQQKQVKIYIDEKNPAYSTVDGNICTKDGKTLLAGIGKGDDNEIFVVPDGITAIGKCALKGGRYSAIIIPSSVQRIGDTEYDGDDVFPVANYSSTCSKLFYKGTKKDWKRITLNYFDKTRIKKKERTVYFYSETPSRDSWRFAPDGVTPVITAK